MNDKICKWASNALYEGGSFIKLTLFVYLLFCKGKLLSDISVQNHTIEDLPTYKEDNAIDESIPVLLLFDTDGCNFDETTLESKYYLY